MKNEITLHPVDQLGHIRSQIASLREQESAIEKELKAGGASVVEGSHFRATISVYSKETVSWKAVAEKLSPSHQLIAAHTSHSTVVAISVKARLTDKQ